ncbi:MAG: ABC transporter permease [Acidobacteriota bacterium]
MMTLFRYRDLIWTLVARDLKVRYRRSVLGFVWTMLQPLLTMMVFYLVFSSLFRFDVRNYPVYALAGILFWNFFQQSIIASMNSLYGNAGILKKVPVPMMVFPVATVISGIVNLLFALVPLFGLLLATEPRLISPALLFLPISIVIAALFTLGAGLLLSPLAVFFHDVRELVGVGLTLLFYMTPCFYPLSIVEGRWFYFLFEYNPTRSILEVFRDPIYFAKIPPLVHLGVSMLVALIALAIGAWVFRRAADRIPFYI